MLTVRIKISGSGLVVSGPAILIIDHLKSLGYEVEFREWEGLDQWKELMSDVESLEFARKIAKGMKALVEVEPYPWGG